MKKQQFSYYGRRFTKGEPVESPEPDSLVICEGKVWKSDGEGPWGVGLWRGGHPLYNDSRKPMWRAVEVI